MSDIQIPTLEAAPATPAARPLGVAVKPDVAGFVWGTGRRKTSVARVRIRPGTGLFEVKGNKKAKPHTVYFTEVQGQESCVAPLKATEMTGKLDVFVTVDGGGFTGQAEAITLGLARALKGYAPELETALRAGGFMTRDDRKVERKKYGQAGARRRFQFSQR